MTQELSWGFWIVIAALLVGAGTFLDRYHVTDGQRNKVRGYLIRCFVYVEKPTIPDFSKITFKFVLDVWKSWYYLGFVLFIVMLYFFITSTFYVTRIFLEMPPQEGYWQYIFNWATVGENPLYWGSVLLWGIGLGLLSFYSVSLLLNRINRYDSVLPQLGWSALANVVAYFWVLIGFAGSLLFFSGGPDAINMPVSGPMMSMSPLLLALSFVVVFPVILWVGLIGNLIFLRLVLHIIQTILLNVFDVASDPKHSPFTYLFSLMGVLILVMKVIVEINK